MNLIYLAYGNSIEAHPHTVNKPLSVIKILDRAAIEHNLEAAAGFCDRIIIVSGFHSSFIKQLLGDKFGGKEITYAEVVPDTDEGSVLNAYWEYCADGFMLLDDNHIYSPNDLRRLADAKSGRLTCNKLNAARAFTPEQARKKIGRASGRERVSDPV